MRLCLVENCPESDKTILSHRFPKNKELATKWAQILGYESYELSYLYHRYVVCSRHFEQTQYRNPTSQYLNFTAIPTLHPVRSRGASLAGGCHEDVTVSEDPNVAAVLENETNEVRHYQIVDEEICFSNNNNEIVDEEVCPSSNDEDINVLVAVDGQNVASWKIPLEQAIADDNSAQSRQDIDEQVVKELFENSSHSEDGFMQVLSIEDVADDEPKNIFEMEPSIENDVALGAESNETVEHQFVDVYDEYSSLTREELIERLVEQQHIIQQQRTRIKCFEEAQEQLLQSMDVFKNMMGGI